MKKLSQEQLDNILNKAINMIQSIDDKKNNHELAEQLMELKEDADNLMDYYIEECNKSWKRNKQSNKIIREPIANMKSFEDCVEEKENE